MSSATSELDLASLHKDTNIGHTLISLESSVTLPPDAFENLLEKACLCTLREIMFDLNLMEIDITDCDDETQLLFLTRLASKRFHSTCFNDSNDTICVKCSLSPDLKVFISNWNVEQLKECASNFLHEASQISTDVKLHLACLAKDHQCVRDLLKEVDSKDLEKRNMMLFYGISCAEIVDVIVKSGVNVNTRDSRKRTPLFYALTSSLDSAKMLLDNDAKVTARDKCNVSVLTFFVEKMLKNQLPADVKGEGIKLLSERINRAQMIKEIISLILCKFIQVCGAMGATSNPQENHLDLKMVCETLKLVFNGINDVTHDDDRNSLITQLQSVQERIIAHDVPVSEVLQIFYERGAKSSARDSEGNTCLHYATQLLFYDVPKKTVTELCRKLIEHDARSVDVTNHKEETPLLFCLSSKHLMARNETSNWSGCLQAVCRLLMVEGGSKLCDTTHKEETAFQLILKICQFAILSQDENRKRCIFEEMFKLLEMFSKDPKSINAVNKGDIHINSPLHLWASLAMKSPGLYREKVYDDYSFRDILEQLLKLLQKCRVKLNDGNDKDETPLHLCRTWTAVKLLLDAGARPNVPDSSGCTPLLAAAKKNTCLKENSNLFYPDVDQTPKEFWQDVLNRKLDPWTADEDGNSVLSVLVREGAESFAKALIEVASELNYVQSDSIGVPLLITLCRNKSTDKEWKVDCVEILLKSSISLVNKTSSYSIDTALHFSCRNILDLPDSSDVTSVHWKIAQYLLTCGADIYAVGERGESCLALSDNCPILQDLLLTPMDHSTLPLVLENWRQSSKSHAQTLSLVARKIKSQHVGSVYFYEEALDKDRVSDSFVFPGIDQGGREVAVKRIDKSQIPTEKVAESVLVLSARCEQIVEYILRVEEGNFHYLAFELMEGDLENHLHTATGAEDTVKLCKDLLTGLQFLQSQPTPVVHGNINPTTVFYQSTPKLCLKIGNCKVRSSRRGWIAPEVLKGTSKTSESDIFSCGLVLHFLLSGRKHPFAPGDSATKSPEEVLCETDTNIKNGNIVKIDDSLSPEAVDLVHLMLDSDPSNRLSAGAALVHPFFWDNETKKKFLHDVGNEPEIAKQVKRHPLTAFESEVEGRFNVIVTRSTAWNDSPPYDNMSATYSGMSVKRDYDYETVAGLIRFIRNAYEHINEQPETIQKMWEDDFVLNDYFPHLVMEVYKALTRSEFHQLHKSRKEIKKFFRELK